MINAYIERRLDAYRRALAEYEDKDKKEYLIKASLERNIHNYEEHLAYIAFTKRDIY